MNVSSSKPHPELCSCPESCCPSKQEDTNLKFLLRVCYTEWVIMGILTIMIMAKLTYLEDKEWVWFMMYSGMLLIFSIPFMVGLHKHTDPSCDCQVQHPSRSDNTEEVEVSSSKDSETELLSKKIEVGSKKKKQPAFGLIKKPVKKTKKRSGKNQRAAQDESSDSSSETASSASTSSSSTKVTKQKKGSKSLTKKKSKISQKKTKQAGSSSKSRKPRKTKAKKVSKLSASSTSTWSEDSHHVEAELTIKRESANESGEEDKLDVDLNIVVDSDSEEESKLNVDVQAKVEEDKMDVHSQAKTKKEGVAAITAEVVKGSDNKKDSLELDLKEEDYDSDDMKVAIKKV